MDHPQAGKQEHSWFQIACITGYAYPGVFNSVRKAEDGRRGFEVILAFAESFPSSLPAGHIHQQGVFVQVKQIICAVCKLAGLKSE